jgi:predicted metal-binding membrane protein
MLASLPHTRETGELGDLHVRIEFARHRTFLGTGALLFAASVATTIYWCNSMSGGMTMPGGWILSMIWMRMQGQSWVDAAASFLGMWVVMMAAMMLPTLLPALLRYRVSLGGPQPINPIALTILAGAGYALVWTILGLVVYPIGVVVAKILMASEVLAHWAPIVVGLVLLVAGFFQLTKWKMHELCRCRAAVFAGGGALRQDAGGAWRYGIRFGANCALCCCGLMAVVLATGVMNLGTMALVAVAISAERQLPRPVWAARAAGIIIIAAAVVMIGRGLRSLWGV